MLWDQNNSLVFGVFFFFVFFCFGLFSYKAEDRLSVKKCVDYRLLGSWFSFRGSRLSTDPWADPECPSASQLRWRTKESVGNSSC